MGTDEGDMATAANALALAGGGVLVVGAKGGWRRVLNCRSVG